MVTNRRHNNNCTSRTINIISSGITVLTFNEQIDLIMRWAKARQSKQVCVANVHMLMEAHWDSDFNDVLNSSDLVAADGMPLVILMKMLGATYQNRVAGMDLFLALCERSSQENISIFFLGSEDSVLSSIRKRLSSDYPHLKVAGMLPLPFRKLTVQEDQDVVEQINQSGAELLFVALGCPKQERWIAEHREKIHATMLGLGAVFPVYAGNHKHAPIWMRNSCLEWLFRLIQEPKRLWRRYLITIPPFLILATKQVLRDRLQYSPKLAASE